MLSDILTNSSNSFLKLKKEGSCIAHFQTKAFVDSQTLSSGHISLGYSQTYPETICSSPQFLNTVIDYSSLLNCFFYYLLFPWSFSESLHTLTRIILHFHQFKQFTGGCVPKTKWDP